MSETEQKIGKLPQQTGEQFKKSVVAALLLGDMGNMMLQFPEEILSVVFKDNSDKASEQPERT